MKIDHYELKVIAVIGGMAKCNGLAIGLESYTTSLNLSRQLTRDYSLNPGDTFTLKGNHHIPISTNDISDLVRCE
jgi:hypothetical protein